MTPALYAILGHTPLTSASPQMQNAGFAALGIDARYLRIAEGAADRALSLGRRLDLLGANVTAPFKEALCAHVELRGDAQRIGAINTLCFEGARAFGLNTDADGVLGACRELGIGEISGKRAVVIGTGGAARAATFALVRQGAEVALLGRNPVRARALAREFGASAAGDLEEKTSRHLVERADLLVSTANTREQVLDPRWLMPHTAVLDALYGQPSQLLLDARRRGCPAIDGLAWLLHQGAAALHLWTGRAPPLAAMRSALSRTQVNGRPKKPRRGIALIGFSGAGKSALAQGLAGRLGLPALDLDLEIERRQGCSISAIFAARGEASFRAIERAVLQEIAARPAILALGGGALIDPANRPLACTERLALFLDIDVETALARLVSGARPLLAAPPGTSPQAWAQQRLDERRDGYLRTCDLVLDAARAPEELADRIAQLWAALT